MRILQNSIDEKINRYWYGSSFNFYLHTMQMIQSSIVDRHIDTEFGNLFVWRAEMAQRRRFNGTVERRFMPSVLCPVSRIITRNSLLLQSMISKPSVHGFMMRSILKFRIKYARDFFLKTFSLIDEYICIYFYFIFFFWLDSLNYEKNM